MALTWALGEGSQRSARHRFVALTSLFRPAILSALCANSPTGLSRPNIRAATPDPFNLGLSTAKAVSSRRSHT
jgi:hypothetical protein